MNLNINAIEICTDIPECMMAEDLGLATLADDHLNALIVYMINGCPSTTVKVKEERQTYCPFSYDIATTGDIVKRVRE